MLSTGGPSAGNPGAGSSGGGSSGGGPPGGRKPGGPPRNQAEITRKRRAKAKIRDEAARRNREASALSLAANERWRALRLEEERNAEIRVIEQIRLEQVRLDALIIEQRRLHALTLDQPRLERERLRSYWDDQIDLDEKRSD